MQKIWVKVFRNGPSKICGRQPLKDLKRYDLRKADYTLSNFLNAVSLKFYQVHREYFVPYEDRKQGNVKDDTQEESEEMVQIIREYKRKEEQKKKESIG